MVFALSAHAFLIIPGCLGSFSSPHTARCYSSSPRRRSLRRSCPTIRPDKHEKNSRAERSTAPETLKTPGAVQVFLQLDLVTRYNAAPPGGPAEARVQKPVRRPSRTVSRVPTAKKTSLQQRAKAQPRLRDVAAADRNLATDWPPMSRQRRAARPGKRRTARHIAWKLPRRRDVRDTHDKGKGQEAWPGGEDGGQHAVQFVEDPRSEVVWTSN